jgi:hypothetical protein
MPHWAYHMPSMQAYCVGWWLYNWIRTQLVVNGWAAAVTLAGAAAGGGAAAGLPAGQWIVLPIVIAGTAAAYAGWFDYLYSRVHSPEAQQQREQVARQYEVQDPPEPKAYPGGGTERAADMERLKELFLRGSDSDMEELTVLLLRDAAAADWKEAGLKELVKSNLRDPAMLKNFVKLRLALRAESLMPEWLTNQIRHGEVVAALTTPTAKTAFKEHVRACVWGGELPPVHRRHLCISPPALHRL